MTVSQRTGVLQGGPMIEVWSCGGGRQSAAIAALIICGELPKPDIAAIVDTGRERSSTWRFVDAVLLPELAKVGVILHRVQKINYATVDLWGGKDGNSLLIPAFTNKNGAIGKLQTFCSNEWKVRVLDRWLREQGIGAYRRWLGISADELQRVRTDPDIRYPLIYDLPHPMRLRHCLMLTKEMGWPNPPKSTCYHCPNQRDAQWAAMKRDDPADFAQAVEIDRSIRERDPNAFLHPSCKPLDQVDFDSQTELGIDRSCQTGMCFT